MTDGLAGAVTMQCPVLRFQRSSGTKKTTENLRLFHGRRETVAHGADVHSARLLLVSLPEELLHDPPHPLVVERLRLGRVAQVGAVSHVLQNLRQVFANAVTTTITTPITGLLVYTVSQKTVQNSSCQNFFEFPPILIIFGRKMVKRLKLYEVHSFSTSSNLRHHTTVLSADVPNCYTTLKVVSIGLLTIASSLR